MNQQRRIQRSNQQKKDKETKVIPPTEPTGTALTARYSSFSGPIPSPQALAFYEQVAPGAASRILKLAEDQQAHRIRLESIAVPETFEANKRGQKFALIIVIFAIIATVFLGWLGMQWAAVAMTLVIGSGVAATFITGKSEQKASMSEKAKEVLETKKQLEKAAADNKKAGE
ncbi:MAG: hypothetical protein CVU43_17825 [Chloroflexi bacterium HGW-Chloroflexi-5]|jgi:uncharacterized membrane protein|nr:MAG: hypothetical protein CVU43_17825 [Chloroflexi bacterium HGW-Chloroflexi-5]